MKEKYPMILLTWNLKEKYKQALALVSWLNKEIYWKSLYPLLLNLKNEVSVVARINKIAYQEKKKEDQKPRCSFIPKSSQLKSTIVPLHILIHISYFLKEMTRKMMNAPNCF